MVDFLQFEGCTGITPVVNMYRSHQMVDEFQDSIYSVIVDEITKKLSAADFISFLGDESCDISNLKKVSVYCKISKDCHAETSLKTLKSLMVRLTPSLMQSLLS